MLAFPSSCDVLQATWTKKAYKKLVADMAAKGEDYEKEKRAKRIAALKAKNMFVERTPKVKAAPAGGKKGGK